MAQETPTKGPRAGLTPMQAALQEIDVVEPGGARQTGLPLVQGAFVVYLGAARNNSIALSGRVFVERIETDEPEIDAKGEPVVDEDGHPKNVFHETRTPHSEGTQVYDFSSHDALGRRIKTRLLPVGGPEVRGKPFVQCEHPEHLRRFLRWKNKEGTHEYRIMAGPEARGVFDDYVRVKERQINVMEEQTRETIAA